MWPLSSKIFLRFLIWTNKGVITQTIFNIETFLEGPLCENIGPKCPEGVTALSLRWLPLPVI